MIEYIRGSIASLNPTEVVIETSGVGYLLEITLSTYSALERMSEVKLLVHEIIREDTHALFGFYDERERALFRLLIGVSGVGANTARVMLSSIPVSELELVIASGDSQRLTKVKGIGKKTAERVVVDLNDKIKPTENTLLVQPQVTGEAFEEALAALTMLGFSRPDSQKALKKLFEAEPQLKVESAIKKALSML